MKVGIFGLTPRQVSAMDKHKIEGLEYTVYPIDRSTTIEAIAKFARDNDHIVALTGYIPKRFISKVPREKCTMLIGGLSAVVRELEELRDRAALTKAKVKKSPKVAPPAEVVKPSEPKPAPVKSSGPVTRPLSERLAAGVPQGWESQYKPPHGEVVINYPNEKGKTDYRIITAALPGEVVRFSRPVNTELDVWMVRISQMRSMYKRVHSILLETHFFEEYVDILVMDQTAGKIEKDPVKVKPEQSEQATLPLDSETPAETAVVEEEAAPVVIEEQTEAPVVEAVKSDTPTGPEFEFDDPPFTQIDHSNVPKVWPSRVGCEVSPSMAELRRRRLEWAIQHYGHDSVDFFADLIGRTVEAVREWLGVAERTVVITTFQSLHMDRRLGLSAGTMSAPLRTEISHAPTITHMSIKSQDPLRPTPPPVVIEEKSVATAAPEVTPEPIPQSPATDLKQDVTPVENKFWREVLLASMVNGQEVDTAVSDADKALAAYQSRFGQ